MKHSIWALVALALLLSACNAPRQPSLMPGCQSAADGGANAAAQGGIAGESKPETGRVYGAPMPTSLYTRGDVGRFDGGDYATESRQAGAITNPKAWTADTNAIASAPVSAKCAAQWLESLALAYTVEKDPMEKAAIRADILSLVDRIQKNQTEYIGAIAALAPRFTRCVMLNLDLSGSSSGGQDAVDPANAQAAGQGVPEAIKQAGKILNDEYEDSPSTSPDAAGTPDFPRSEPPAGVALPTGGSDG